jgi:hypothetical protein
MPVSKWLVQSETDAFLVLHDGHIVAEQYFGEMTPDTRHILWCGGKSILTSVLARYFAAGTLNAEVKATECFASLPGD